MTSFNEFMERAETAYAEAKFSRSLELLWLAQGNIENLEQANRVITLQVRLLELAVLPTHQPTKAEFKKLTKQAEEKGDRLAAVRFQALARDCD
jgi:hypothetical protein